LLLVLVAAAAVVVKDVVVQGKVVQVVRMDRVDHAVLVVVQQEHRLVVA
jgi:hypothetical protein